MTFYFSIISICVSIPINAFNASNVEDYFERTTLNNKEMTMLRSWVHVALIFVFTVLTIRAVIKIRKEARLAYQFYHKGMSKNKDHEWLKARTIHVKGIPPEDRAGNILKIVLDRVLSENNGEVLGMVMVPDFVN